MLLYLIIRSNLSFRRSIVMLLSLNLLHLVLDSMSSLLNSFNLLVCVLYSCSISRDVCERLVRNDRTCLRWCKVVIGLLGNLAMPISRSSSVQIVFFMDVELVFVRVNNLLLWWFRFLQSQTNFPTEACRLFTLPIVVTVRER